jgi:hypothetical protein
VHKNIKYDVSWASRHRGQCEQYWPAFRHVVTMQ